MKRLALILVGTLFCLVVTGTAGAAPWDWSEYYLHTQTGGTTEIGQWIAMRGLALSKDGSDSLYWGHTMPARADSSLFPLPAGSVNVVRLDSSAAVMSYVNCGQQKALATDDRGYVYAAMNVGGAYNWGNYVDVFDATLSAPAVTRLSLTQDYIPGVTPPKNTKYGTEGVDVQKSGSAYYLYTSNRSSGMVRKYDVTNVMAPVDTGWFCDLPDYSSTELRGLAVDSAGAVWVADYRGKVHKIAPDGLSYTSVTVPQKAMDVCIYGDSAYVTTGNTVEMLKVSDMSLVRSLTNPYGSEYGLGGLDVSADGQLLYVTGVTKTITGTDRRTFEDRILTLQTPEPATMAFLALGGIGMLARRRRK